MIRGGKKEKNFFFVDGKHDIKIRIEKIEVCEKWNELCGIFLIISWWYKFGYV